MIIKVIKSFSIFINETSDMNSCRSLVNIDLLSRALFLQLHLILFGSEIISHSELGSHEMCVNLRLLHEILKPFLLQECFFLLLLLLLELLVKFLPFPFAISHFLIPFPPEVRHFLSELPCAHHRLFGESLGSHSAFSYLLEAVLGDLFIVVLLVRLELLVHTVSFWNVFFHNVRPSSLDVLGFLLVLGFLGSILDLVPLVKDVSHISLIYLFLFNIVTNEVRIELKRNHLPTINSLESHVGIYWIYDLLARDRLLVLDP